MRIVLDTNVLVSGLLSPYGPSANIVRWVALGEPVLCYDARIFAEYREVLAREKLGFDPEQVADLLEQIRTDGYPVVARPLETRLPDPDDEAFLEVALTGSARFLVTRNLKHYPQEARQGVEVVPPARFVTLFRAKPEP